MYVVSALQVVYHIVANVASGDSESFQGVKVWELEQEGVLQ